MKKGFSQGVCAITDAELINSTPSAHYEAVLARLDSEDREVIERLRTRLTGIRNIGPAGAADLIIRMGMVSCYGG